MDRYLDQYKIIESQQFRDGIKFTPSWISRLFKRK